MLDFKLPVYALRAFVSIEQEGDYSVITTRYNKYVLDNRKLPGTFSQRRFILFEKRKELPYKLYPIRGRISMLSQLVGSKRSQFIDSDGNLINWKKTTFYDVVTSKVLHSARIYNGKYQCYVAKVPYPFVLSYVPAYISYILVNNSPVIYQVHQEEPEIPRLRIKL